jgi:nucleotide-binding universal stress UspA family protein
LLRRVELETARLDAEGDPAGAILEAANDRAADVVIVGRHGGTPEAGPALGGTARRVIEAADVPVVVVPPSV